MNILIKKIESCSVLPHHFFCAFGRKKYAYLLESGRPYGEISRYSFAGTNPFLIFKSKKSFIEISNPLEGWKKKLSGKSIDILRNYFNHYRKVRRSFGFPFCGGAVGYFGYNINSLIEEKVVPNRNDLPSLPDLFFIFCDSGAVFDHKEGTLYLYSLPIFGKNRAEREISFLERTYEKAINLRRSKIKEGNRKNSFKIIKSTSKKEYCRKIEKIKKYIEAGDVYEVNLSHRIVVETSKKPFEVYCDLRKIDPTPFSGYLKFDALSVISASPERFLKVHNRSVQTRPIKGTMPRGRTKNEDNKNRKKLAKSIKDKAENIMIVDLSRNDLGRVCATGTVKPQRLMDIESYSKVFQMVSSVEGKLKRGKNIFDCIDAAFPPGSMTGAPKIRAMQIIEELEEMRRGIYSGALGYISFSGNMDLNVIIRTFIYWKKKYYLQVGGAVVADSIPEEEYKETLYKAQSLINAIKK